MSLLPRLAILLLCTPLLAAAQSVVVTEHVRAELLVHAPEGVAPGKPVWLGLSIAHQPHWHTYWKNPGDSGLPTTLSWKLPDGVTAGEIQWPTPKRLPFGPLLNYGYDDRLLLPVALTVADGFSSDLEVKLRADWLVCEEICIPETGEFSLRIPASTPVITNAGRFDAAAALVPLELAQAVVTGRIDGQVLVVDIDHLPPDFLHKDLQFFAEIGGVIDHAAAAAQQWTGDHWTARVPLSAQRSESPAVMPVVLVVPGEARGARVQVPITEWSAVASPAVSPSDAAPAVAAPATASFALALGLALLGGMLLNLMPCVFPVLSLKVLDFAEPGQDGRSRIHGGLAYAAGVIVSFVALAALLILLRAGGEQFGWGFQLQSPVFVALLAALFTLIGLNLAGVFEFASVLPSRIGNMRARHPTLDHALTGALAVAVASPCTGPFMGVALGAALTLPIAQALVVFAVLGLGMALPYLLLSMIPALATRLPRPGIWMLRFKVLMAFPMFATVIWLLWVLGQQVGMDGVAGLMAVLLALSFVAWAIGATDFSRSERIGFGTLAAIVLAATLAWALPGIRMPTEVTAAVPATARWQPWSQSAQSQALAEGRPVFVDFTAAWCITCQFNKRTALADADVLDMFGQRDVVLLRADWTRRDAGITTELARLGRSGVPVYAFYVSSAQAPELLPEILRVSDLRRVLNRPSTPVDGLFSTALEGSP
jgi:thiol:disulfide interchange protein